MLTINELLKNLQKIEQDAADLRHSCWAFKQSGDLGPYILARREYEKLKHLILNIDKAIESERKEREFRDNQGL